MSNHDHYEVVMPKLGLVMTEALLVQWYQQHGDWVENNEPLFALESDKSTIEIEAPASGYLEIVVPEGQTVPVMTPVAYLVAAKETFTAVPKQVPPTFAHVVPHAEHDQTLAVENEDAGEMIRATPKARRLARQRGLDLAGRRGSGLRAMVVSKDLERFIQPVPTNATPIARKMATDCGLDLKHVTGTGARGQITREDVTRTLATIVAGSSEATVHSLPPAKKLPLSGLRAVIAERLAASWQERPQVTLTSEVDVANLVSARRQLIAETGKKVGFNAFFVLAAAWALREHPHVNVCLTSSELVTLTNINIGVAVDTERGLLAPVVRDADKKSIISLDTEIANLAQRAQDGDSLPDELTGGTFTITNLGAFGIDAFTPIINPPQTAVLGIGRIAPRPYAVGRQLEVRDTVTLSLSFDHRLIDGAPAARFLQRIAELIQRPIALLGFDHESG
jgi:pyruvate dehydrogenase E2 component (dihydrolipoamide acetyltransferase)